MIRGPRPPSAQWTFQPPDPTRSVTKKNVDDVGAIFHVAQRMFPTEFVSVPDEVHGIACARVKQLQNAINALDEEDPSVASLRAELRNARSKARLVPVENRIKSTTAFLERAPKRESVARKELEVAQEDIRDGEARPERLQEEAAQDVNPPAVTGSSTNAELERLRGLVWRIDPGQFREEVCRSFRNRRGHDC